MPEALGAFLGWLIPAVVVFGVAALAVAAIVWAVRRARRSPRARSRAEAARDRAGVALVRLDDAVSDLEIEVGLSGALYGGGAPSSLRRARLSAQHVRDESFDQYRVISEPDASPPDIERAAARIERRATEAIAAIARAKVEHARWVDANVSATVQVSAAVHRLGALRDAMGDPAALVSDLSSRVAEEEWAAASRAAHSAISEADAAERLLRAAADEARDPSKSALPSLAQAERALRQAEVDARLLEEHHRLVTQAEVAVPGEFAAARAALRQAMTIRDQLDAVDAERLGAELRGIESELSTVEVDAARRPTRAVEAVARLRDRLDIAVGDARTAQQRLRGARTALPGTLATARSALASAEASIAHSGGGADARSRLLSAQAELARARQAGDPVEALDAARRAMRDAEDAKALADYGRITRGR